MTQQLTFIEYCTQLYRSKFDEQDLINQFKDITGENLSDFDERYAYVIWYLLNTDPSQHFTQHVFKGTVGQLKKGASVNVVALEKFYVAFKNYRRSTKIIQDFADSGMPHEGKNQLYRLPIYTALIDDCLTPLYEAILLLVHAYKDDFTLPQLCVALANNQFAPLTKPVNFDVHEAIHQGNFLSLSEGKTLAFSVAKAGGVQLQSFSFQEFEGLMDDVYDTCSAILLGLAQWFSEAVDHVDFVANANNLALSFEQLALEFSLPHLACTSIFETSRDHQQISLNVRVQETNPNFLICTAIELITQFFNQYPHYQRYLVNFEHERLAISFVRITAKEMHDLIEDYTRLSDYVEQMIKRGDIQISNPSIEAIDLHAIAQYHYPTFKGEDFVLHTVENISTKQRKRFKADLYIGEVADKAQINHLIKTAIDSLKTVKNMANPKAETVHGMMEADSIYLNVYRQDKRQSKDVESTNENFVCFVDYNRDGKSTLKNGGILPATWNQLHHEQNGFINIAWRQKLYVVDGKSTKIGRNDLCPCGSGRKYKKCHGK